MESLFGRLLAAARARPEHPAILQRGAARSYGWLLQRVEAGAEALSRAGAGRHARVALLLPNGTEFVASFFAVARIGGMVLPLNPALRPPEIAALLQDAQVSLVVTSSELSESCREAIATAPGLAGVTVLGLDEAAAASRPAPAGTAPAGLPPDTEAPQAPFLYLYSSGSTGQPKRIERSQSNLIWETDRLVGALGLSPADRVLGVAPFSHVNGLMRSMVASVLAGATLVPVAQFERRAVARAIAEHAITVFIGVPFMFAMLAETRWPRPVDFSSLRHCVSASAPLRPETSRRFHERYGVYVRQLYGTTETGTISLDLESRSEDSLPSVGTPLEGVAVEVVSEDGRLLGPGETGEIAIRSPAAAREYPGRPDETAASFVRGSFRPGDIGYRDAAGRVHLLGRKSLFINRGGYKVNPREIEEVIQQHPKVEEAAVVGVDAEFGDQKIKAVVVARQPCEALEIIEFCRTRVADFKVPSIVEFRAELPKSATGKPLRRAL